MDPVVQAGGSVMVWGLFSWHTLGPLVSVKDHLNVTAYRHLSQWLQFIHPLVAASSKTMHHIMNKKKIAYWFMEGINIFCVLKCPPHSQDLNPLEHIWYAVKIEIQILDVQPTNLEELQDSIILKMLPEHCQIYSKNWGGSKGRMMSNPILEEYT